MVKRSDITARLGAGRVQLGFWLAVSLVALAFAPSAASAVSLGIDPQGNLSYSAEGSGTYTVADWRVMTERLSASAAVRRYLVPERGPWSGPLDPYGRIRFEVSPPRKHKVWTVKKFRLVGHAHCTTGRKVGFDLETRGEVGIAYGPGIKHPFFGFSAHGRFEGGGASGTFRVYVTGRFISHVRAVGEYEVDLQTNQAKWGYCEADDVSYHATPE